MLTRRLLAVALALTIAAGGVVATAGSASAANSTYAIGDSVMLGAKPKLKARSITVNATVSRHFYDVAPLVRKLKKKGKLPRKVVVAVGMNTSGISVSQCKAIVKAVGKSRKIWFVSLKGPRSWVAPNNKVLTTCANTTKATLIPWHKHARGHGNWFYSDGIHLTSNGAKAYAKFIDRYV